MIFALDGNQIFVTTHLDDLPLIQDANLVCVSDGGQPVRDDDADPIFEQCP